MVDIEVHEKIEYTTNFDMKIDDLGEL